MNGPTGRFDDLKRVDRCELSNVFRFLGAFHEAVVEGAGIFTNRFQGLWTELQEARDSCGSGRMP